MGFKTERWTRDIDALAESMTPNQLARAEEVIRHARSARDAWGKVAVGDAENGRICRDNYYRAFDIALLISQGRK